MNALVRIAQRRPWLFAVLLSLSLLIAVLVVGTLAFFFGQGDMTRTLIVQALGRLVFVALLVLWLQRLGWLDGAGYRTWAAGRIWLMALAATVYVTVVGLYAISGDLRFDLSDRGLIVGWLVSELAVGLLEETVFRGLILYAMLRCWGSTRRGVVKSLFFSTLFFCVLHLVSALGAKDLPTAGMQVLQVFALGLFDGALLIYGGSIWPPVVFHGLSNALVNIGLIGKELGETLQSSVVFFLLLIPIAVWAWILARRSERWPANEE